MAATTITRTEQVLAAARETHAAMVDLEVEQLVQAVEWAELHPGEPVDESIPWAERELEVAGPGAPTVSEFSVAEFALAIGKSTDAGISYVGDAVELCHRLPRLWARVTAGEVPVWKAQKVAQQTRSLSMEAAGYVDQHLAPTLHRCSFAQIERAVDDARRQYDPAEAEARRIAAAEVGHFDIHLHQVSYDGRVRVEGDLDLADAFALDDVISARAATLDPELSAGCAPVDGRRPPRHRQRRLSGRSWSTPTPAPTLRWSRWRTPAPP